MLVSQRKDPVLESRSRALVEWGVVERRRMAGRPRADQLENADP
jgi:hypothetical protein